MDTKQKEQYDPPTIIVVELKTENCILNSSNAGQDEYESTPW